MNTQLQPKENSEIQTLPTPTPMDLMQSAVANNVDAEQLSKLMDLQDRYEANQSRRAFSNAVADFQAKCPTILKSRKADRYNYAPLDTVLRTIRPHLEDAGLSVRFSTMMHETTVITAICTVSHRDGHSEVSEFSACIDEKMRVNDTQKIGSANSYAKRYALMNALNLVASDEDDDGFLAGNELIDGHQEIEINDMLEATKSDVAAFLRWAKVESVADMPASKYPQAMKLLRSKQK